MNPCSHIHACRPGGFLYIGVTDYILRRLAQHLRGKVRYTRFYEIARLWRHFLAAFVTAVAVRAKASAVGIGEPPSD